MKLRLPNSFGVSWTLLILACVAGALGFIASRVLVLLIVGIANFVFRQNLSFTEAFPIADVSPWLCLFVPICGGLVLGLKARFVESGIRGHGIPEIIERIYAFDGVIPYRMIWIRPLASALSIGTGGPYGAEGPVIGTGAAIGSSLAQFCGLSRDERNLLLAAGAAAGVSAMFGTPMAGVFLAIELLLFQYRLTAFVPIGLASLVAYGLRTLVFGDVAVFPNVAAGLHPHMARLVLLGVVEGLAAAAVILSVEKVEGLYKKLPLHWMWWPALGAIAVGAAGFWNARSLGPGYDILTELLGTAAPSNELLALCAVKAVVWIIAVSSMTTGGTLAPLLIMGGGLGVALTGSGGIGALIGMAAFFGAIAHAPLSGLFLVLEMTHSYENLPLTMLAVLVAYVVVKLALPHSIMTHGLHHKGHKLPELH